MKPKPDTLETKNIGCYDVHDDVMAAVFFFGVDLEQQYIFHKQ
jgi:hypothetical protein